jgi:hypothetical protein
MALETFFKVANRPGVEQVRQNQIQAQLDRKMANEAAQRNAIAELLNNQGKRIANRRNNLANTDTALKMAQFGKPVFGDLVQQPDGSFVQPKLDRQGRVTEVMPVAGMRARTLHPAKQALAEFLPPNVDPYTATDKQYMEAAAARKRYKVETNPSYVFRTEQREEERQAETVEKDKAKDFASDTYDIAQRLLDSSGLEDAVGTVQGRLPSFDRDTVDFENDLEFLTSRLTKENLGIMKGVLSDNDIRILTNIGAGELKLVGSEDRMRQGLKRVMNKLAKASERPIPYPELSSGTNLQGQQPNNQAQQPNTNQRIQLNGTNFSIRQVSNDA